MFLLIFLMIIGIFGAGIGGKAYADSCGKRGRPGAELPGGGGGGEGGERPDSNTRKNQIKNAKTIDQVAIKGKLSGRATLIALMTALQESTLLNLDHGDRDSIGLFQQRPSQGWGTKDEIMNPEYSAGMFFHGAKDGDPPGLDDVKGWETMSIRTVILKVQRPDARYADLYVGQEDPAREIAREAGIDLDRKGESGTTPGDQGGTDGTTGGTGNSGGTDDKERDPNFPSGECYEEDKGGGGVPGKPGSPFHDGEAGWPPEVKNPYSVRAAIAFARREAHYGEKKWYRACLAFAAVTHGWSYSGVYYAIDHYREMPESMKHDGDRNPPPGALLYWDTGQRAGHVAVYLGNGEIASNDIRRPGYIDIVPADEIEKKWGAKYLGWAPPYFPKGG
ncbi:peptidase M23 [Streptomyces hydrogenans]|uniref:peptidase M23 n=1 Tax=Streptomyces hydrogenans TaxID=1873719 RepID=UPI003D75DDFA